MAESSPKTNTGILAKAQKRLSRTKTKVLQNLGKADKTKDEVFNNYVSQIEELQERTHPLHKEIHHYLQCLKSLNQASKSLSSTFQSVYEEGWPDKELMKEQLQTCDLLWNDYLQNVQDSVITPMNSFLQHFPVFKAKIAKRGRKMVDYDNARHHLEVLNAAKKKDDLKIEKAQEDLKETKRIYEEMNQELLAEMPAFYQSRCHFVPSLFTSLYGTEFVFHSEFGKVCALVGDSCQKFASQSEPMNFKMNSSFYVSIENGTPSSPSDAHTSVGSGPSFSSQATTVEKSPANINGTSKKHAEEANKDIVEEDEVVEDSDSDNRQPVENDEGEMRKNESKDDSDSSDVSTCDDPTNTRMGVVEDEREQVKSDGNLYEEPAFPATVKVNGMEEYKSSSAVELEKDEAEDVKEKEVEKGEDAEKKVEEKKEDGKKEVDEDGGDDNDEDEDGELYTLVPSNMPVHQPPEGMLYQVEATHRYTGEDVDELSFDAGEIISVIPFENPDEQDDGWQMGIKQSDGIKGVFPENFTKKM